MDEKRIGSDTRTTRRVLAIVRLAVVSLSMVAAMPALAVSERLAITQAADGSIIATLSGEMFPCSFAFILPPTVTAAGADYTITSTLVALGCPVPAGPPPSPFGYSIPVNLGHVADGVHVVTWNFTGAVNGTFVATFTVANGLLVLPTGVPALTPVAAAVLALLLVLLASPRLRWARP